MSKNENSQIKLEIKKNFVVTENFKIERYLFY